jgi:hypothetical protein
MKHFLTMLLLGFSVMTIGQQKITFEYDKAGNQIFRKLCLNCTNKKSKGEPKEIEAITEQDLQKFFPEDAISYYPNPVSEELYLKWALIEGNYVSSIRVYSFNGQVLKIYSKSDETNAQTIPFQPYPTGTYLIVLKYNNGDEKTIKIIKQ